MDTEPARQPGSVLSPSLHRVGRLGALVWDQWAALRHAAAVVGTVLGVGNAHSKGRGITRFGGSCYRTARLPEITGALADEAKDLPGLVPQTQTSMRELERLIDAMQRHWFLRRYVNKPNPPPLPPLPGAAEPEKPPVKVLRSPRGSTP